MKTSVAGHLRMAMATIENQLVEVERLEKEAIETRRQIEELKRVLRAATFHVTSVDLLKDIEATVRGTQ